MVDTAGIVDTDTVDTAGTVSIIKQVETGTIGE
jgi:hypothetical protein